MSYFESFPQAKLVFFALPLLVWMILMGMFFPQVAPEGYSSFIVAFEFVTTPEGIFQLFKLDDSINLHHVDIGNYIDFGFMLTYSLFLFLFWKKNFSSAGTQTLRFGYLLVALVLIGDFVENLQLLGITSEYLNNPKSDFAPYLGRLQIFTWLKWECLAIIFAGMGTVLIRRGLFSKVLGYVSFVPFLISLKAFGGSAFVITVFTSSIFLMFFLLLVYVASYRPVSH